MATTTSTTSGGGKKKTAAAGRKNALAGFLVDKIDGDLMRAYVKKNKLKNIDVDVADEQLAVALVMHFKETVPPTEQVRCEECFAISHEEEDVCPVCGDEGEVDGDEEVSTAPAAAESGPASVAADDADEEDEEDDEESEEEDEDDEDEEDDAEEDEEEEDAAPEKAAAAKEEPEVTTPPKKATKKEAVAMKAETHVNGASTPKKKSAALAKPAAEAEVADGGKKKTEKDLDNAVKEVQRLLVDSHVSYYEFAKKIFEINDKQLWKLRKTEEGKARYTSWDAFVHHELKMSPTHSYNAIECAKNYKSAEEIRELGGKTKAVLLLKAAPVDRPALAAAAKAGATKRELEKGVAESRKKHGPTKKSPQAQAGAKGAAAQKKSKSVEKISVANIEGSRTIKLYKKPETMKGLAWPPEKRAAKLGDLPFGRLELQPGVVQYFSVLQKDGELILNIQTRREES